MQGQAGQAVGYQGVGELGGEGFPGDEHAVVEVADQKVDDDIDVGAGGQFAAGRRQLERGAVAVAVLGYEFGLEPGRDRGVVLGLPTLGWRDESTLRAMTWRSRIRNFIGVSPHGGPPIGRTEP